jgi:hypothetical protein
MANRCSRGDNVVAVVVDGRTVARARIVGYSQGRPMFPPKFSPEEYERRWGVTLRDVSVSDVPLGATLVSDLPPAAGSGETDGR